jgi:two-component system LytT family response regulator
MNFMQSDAVNFKVLIVDDESLGCQLIRSLLASDEEIEVAGEATSAREAKEKIQDLKPDLVFMDIEMPGGNGMKLLRELTDPVPYVIFVTAHAEFALPAFELHAFDYLVKPVQRGRFVDSVIRAKHRIAERRIAGLATQIASAASATRSSGEARDAYFPRKLTVRVRRKLLSLDMDEIAWIEGASQYSRVHTRHGEYLLSRTLASLESELDPTRFFRIHRSAIVNAVHVREVRSNGDGRYNIHLSGGPTLPLGRARKEILQALLSGLSREA